MSHDDAFARAYERAAYARDVPTFDAYAAQERGRVRAIIASDGAYREREEYRRQATLQVASGSFENIADTVVEPTPEWLEKGPVRSFTPRLPDGAVRTTRTVRSV